MERPSCRICGNKNIKINVNKKRKIYRWYCKECKHNFKMTQKEREAYDEGKIKFKRSKWKRIDYLEVEKLYYKGLTDTKIAQKIGCSKFSVFNWRKENGLAPNIFVYHTKEDIEKQKKIVVDELKALLRKNGPMRISKIEKVLNKYFVKYSRLKRIGKTNYAGALREILCQHMNIFGYAEIKVGRRGTSGKYKSYRLIDGLSSSHIGPIIWLKGDKRIIQFVGSKIMIPESHGEKCAISHRMNQIFGKELARKIIFYAKHHSFLDSSFIGEG